MPRDFRTYKPRLRSPAISISRTSSQVSISDETPTLDCSTGAPPSVKLVKSVAGTRQDHRDTIRGLGLRKLNSESTLEDTPAVRGMINKIAYLVKVL